jgi:hypothetical protein
MSDFYDLTLLLFVAAVLYTSVGHAGASGYLAAMAFYGLAPADMRPTALVLNLVAATLAITRFRSAGHFDKRLFLMLAAGSRSCRTCRTSCRCGRRWCWSAA